jgi:hypothetical protein
MCRAGILGFAGEVQAERRIKTTMSVTKNAVLQNGASHAQIRRAYWIGRLLARADTLRNRISHYRYSGSR